MEEGSRHKPTYKDLALDDQFGCVARAIANDGGKRRCSEDQFETGVMRREQKGRRRLYRRKLQSLSWVPR